MQRWKICAGIASLTFLVSLGTAASAEPAAPESTKITTAFGSVPLAFEANRGQADPQVRFLARLNGSTLFLTHDEAVIVSPGKAPLRLAFHNMDANAKILGIDQQSGKSNYFLGNDPSKWRTNVPQFAKVKYAGVYPGIDLVFYGNQRNLEYDFVVAPGGDPKRIAMDIEGPAPSIDKNGNLVAGDACFHQPLIYQIGGGRKQAVEGGYVLNGKGRVSFVLGKYDRTRELLIDPVLTYSTYLGGTSQDLGGGVAIDSSGSAYVTGYATSMDFPTTMGAYQTALDGDSDIFITKFSPTGNSLIYSTYLGGSGAEYSSDAVGIFVHKGIAVDSNGEAYVVGDTGSSDFPVTAGAYQSSCVVFDSAECFTTFVSKLSADGSALMYSTYLGGSAGDEVVGVALDSAAFVYVAGVTYSSDFPTTPNSFLPALPSGCSAGIGNAFISKLDSTASGSSSLVYSTYIDSYYAPTGQQCGASINGMTADSSGNAYIAGNWAITEGSPPMAEGTAFAAEFNLSQSGTAALVGSYEFGVDAYPYAVASDNNGNLYVTGAVVGCFGVTEQLCTVNGFQPTLAGTRDAFVAKLNLTVGTVGYLSYLGGADSGEQAGYGISVDGSEHAYVTGYTDAADFPLLKPIQKTLLSGTVGFVTEVSASGKALVYSTLFGQNVTFPVAVATDASGNAYVSGYVDGASLPVVQWYEGAPNGTLAAFLAKISRTSSPGIAFTPGTLNFGSVNLGSAVRETASLLAAGSQGLSIGSIVASANYAVTSNCPETLGAGAACTLTITFTPTAAGDTPGTVTVTDNAAGSPHMVILDGVGVASSATVAPTALEFAEAAIGAASSPKYVKITNNGPAVLTVNSAMSNLTDYAVTNLCTAPLKAGRSCDVEVVFTPSANGPRNGALTITDNGTVSPVVVTLSGEGPEFTIANDPTSATVAAGSAAQTTVTLTPTDSFAGSVALTCSVPTGVGLRCSIAPTSVTLNGSPGSATLTIHTSATTPAGTYTIRSTGNYGSGIVERSATYALTVE